MDKQGTFKKLPLLSILTNLSTEREPTHLQISSNWVNWSLYLEQGKVIYASHSIEPFERLERHLSRIDPRLTKLVNEAQTQLRLRLESAPHSGQHLDYQVICWLVDHQYLTSVQAAALIEGLAKEVIELLLLVEAGIYEIQELGALNTLPKFCELDLQTLVKLCHKRLQSWQLLRPQIWSPYQRPYFSRLSRRAEQEILLELPLELLLLLKEGVSFYQLAVLLNQDELQLAQRLHPYIVQKNILLHSPAPAFARLPNFAQFDAEDKGDVTRHHVNKNLQSSAFENHAQQLQKAPQTAPPEKSLIRQLMAFPTFRLSFLILMLLLIVETPYLLMQQRIMSPTQVTSSKSSNAGVAVNGQMPDSLGPNRSSDIQLYNSMQEVPNVPGGLFNYGGAILFAPLRSPSVLNAIIQAQPQFRLRYVDPVYGRASSHKGVTMLLNDELSFSQSAMPLSDSEYNRARTRGFTLQEVPVAINGVTFFTHPGINIPGLSVDQLQGIYTGKITNWSQVGGPNLAVVPIAIDPKNSSTLAILLENVGGIGSIGNVRIARDYTASIRQTSATPGGISFGSASTVIGQRTIRPLSIAKVHSTSYINPYNSQGRPNAQAFRDGTYPLTHRIFVVIRRDGTPNEVAGVAYTNILLSAEGQKLVEKAGFVPIH